MNIPAEFTRQRVGVAGWRVLSLDLDGVCADYTQGFRKYCMSEMGRPAGDFPDPTDYNLVRSGWPFVSNRDFLSWHRRAVEDGLLRNLPLYPGVAAAMERLSNERVYIRIVSHRLFLAGLHQKIVTDTAAWLDMCRLPYMSLCFTGLKDSVEATVYVDDSPDQIKTLREVGKGVVVVFDQPYNRTLDGPRITDWESGVEKILELFDSI